jgi:4-amino-4-deoxy-L-arabinose transferase-like glycosyltransferase
VKKIKKQDQILSSRLIWVAIFLLALAVRLIYLLEIKNTDAFTCPIGDGFVYKQWALDIAAGNWLGTEVFYQSPFYPYFLALVSVSLGENLVVIRIIQIVLSSLSCLLLALAGESFFSRRVGVITGLLAALYPVGIFFDGLVQKTAFDFFFSALLLFALAKALSKYRWPFFLLAGFAVGLLTLNRENALIYVPLTMVWILLFFRHYSLQSRLMRMGVFLMGILLIVSPVCFRNWNLGGNFSVTSGFGSMFYLGNNPNATGFYTPLKWGRGDAFLERQDAIELAEQNLKRKLTPAEASSFWSDQAFRFIHAHPLPWLKLTARKWFLIWNAAETPDTDAIEAYCDSSHLLNILYRFFHFGVLVPLALLGIVVSWKTRDRSFILYLLLFGMAAAVALFFVFARYRFVLIPILVLFAAVFVSALIDWVREGRYKTILMYGIALLLVAVPVNWPIYPQSENNHRALAYYNIAVTLVKTGNFDRADANFQKALQLKPNSALYHVKYSFFLADQRRYTEAVSHMLTALSIYPALAVKKQCNELAAILLHRREIDAALACYTALLKLEPDNPVLNFNAGYAFFLKGDLLGAVTLYRKALQLKPDLKEAQVGLAIAQGKQRAHTR